MKKGIKFLDSSVLNLIKIFQKGSRLKKFLDKLEQ